MAYEMRISDWSSDVCSSDLRLLNQRADLRPDVVGDPVHWRVAPDYAARIVRQRDCRARRRPAILPVSARAPPAPARSEEHTSELQSLMRISYAVFCLKKKNSKSNYLPAQQPHTKFNTRS